MDRFLSINVLLGINTCYLVSFRGYGRLILQKYDVFNSIQFILIVFWGKAWLCLPPRGHLTWILERDWLRGLCQSTCWKHMWGQKLGLRLEKKSWNAGDASWREEVISFCLLFAECPTVAMSEVPLWKYGWKTLCKDYRYMWFVCHYNHIRAQLLKIWTKALD